MDVKSEIEAYCRLNQIDDVEGFKEECLRQGFNIIKYGVSPQDNFKRENNTKSSDGGLMDERSDIKNSHSNVLQAKMEQDIPSEEGDNVVLEKTKKKKIKIIKN